MSVHIDNQPLYISSNVKSSEVYSHEVDHMVTRVTLMQHHREGVTLECYPPAHHTVTGSGHLQDTDLK